MPALAGFCHSHRLEVQRHGNEELASECGRCPSQHNEKVLPGLGMIRGRHHWFPIRSGTLILIHTGKLSCFRLGISTCLFLSIASARATRRRVSCGMITSSI
jgi:hypothetical protein